jgi:cellulose synthase/poly-beta-1,6-N-acetylglucosamine synthase-like glycosyltransferase
MTSAALGWPWTAAVLLFGVVQTLLLLYAAQRLLTLRRWARARHRRTPRLGDPTPWPAVTVQLPVFNERAVVERLIDAAACLDYPAHLLEIQVLDDSTDETLARARERVAYWRAGGVAIDLLHRDDRAGFKAGALSAGVEAARGEIIAVFDADFVPAPDFLRRIVPRFSDARVGMVQARWSHLNRHRSPLTVAQAVMLDAHFLLEHEARMAAGLFFNFNGSAGAWRRACIEDAGGWSHDTLTEDLDLSYRAQLRGWGFVSAADVLVPAELPGEVLALKSQQRRWAKGSIQTARKVLPDLLRGRLPARIKVEALAHLTANVTYPLLLLSGVLLAAVIMVPATLPPGLAMLLDVSAIACGVVPVVAFLHAGQHAAGARVAGRPSGILSALVVGAGLTLNNTLAVAGGLRAAAGDWERTPKTGEAAGTAGKRAYAARPDRAAVLELGLAVFFAAVACFAWQEGRLRSIPFLLLLATGLAYVGTESLLEAAGARRGAAATVATGRRERLA